MNTQQLQCFIYVAERLNFTKAAESLYLSVPTVTHHIKSLEEELGVQLFYRSSRVVQLTESGETFYHDARDILYRIEKAKDQFQENPTQESVIFRIGCMAEVELKKLEPILKDMKPRFPYIRPKVMVNDFFVLKNLTENRQLDLLIATKGISNQCHFKKMVTHQSYAVVASEHPLAKEKEVTFVQLAKQDSKFITLPPRCVPFESGNKLQESLTLHGQNHMHIISEGEQESILLAKCGYGIALLPGFCIPKEETGIVTIPITGTKNIEYGVYYVNKEPHIMHFIGAYGKTGL